MKLFRLEVNFPESSFAYLENFPNAFGTIQSTELKKSLAFLRSF